MLKLNVGTSRKVGQPDYGSAGASCNLEVELDTALFHDLNGLQHVVQRAYAACNQAVNDELSRLSGSASASASSLSRSSSSGSNGHQHCDLQHQPQLHHAATPVHEVSISPVIHGARFTPAMPPATGFHASAVDHAQPNGNTNANTRSSSGNIPSPRPATTSQVRAIRAICGRQKIDLTNLLRERYGLQSADQLGIRQASDLIDELKNAREDGGNNASPQTRTAMATTQVLSMEVPDDCRYWSWHLSWHWGWPCCWSRCRC